MSTLSGRRVQIEGIRFLLLVIGLILIAVPFLWSILTAFKRPGRRGVCPAGDPQPVHHEEHPEPQREWLRRFAAQLLHSDVHHAGVHPGPRGAGGLRVRSRKVSRTDVLGRIPAVQSDGAAGGFHIPLFLFFNKFALTGTYTGLTLAYLTGLLPFTVWMSASYFQDIPKELEEAARVDGASRAQTFFRIALPLALPGVVSVGLLVAIAAWSEYFIPLILAGPSTTPATVGIVSFIGVDSINWGAMAAGALALIIPVFFATLLAQRGLLRGLTAGAVKG